MDRTARDDSRCARAGSGWSGMEALEARQMLSAAPVELSNTSRELGAVLNDQGAVEITREELTRRDVRRILAQAASQANPGQVISVVDREGFILGIFAVGRPPTAENMEKATARARTAAYFQSHGEAFTTRTARFIIQDRFPFPVPNTPGGPLYGVQFSSLRGSDVLPAEQTPGVSGDPGGIPLYKNGRPVGGVGVAGDGRDIAPREDFLPEDGSARPDNPRREFFDGHEERDFDEAVALAGARGYMAPKDIQATGIFIDGLRLPFTRDEPANGRPQRSLNELINSGAGSLIAAPLLRKDTPRIEEPPPETHPVAVFSDVPGHIMNRIRNSNDDSETRLTKGDVRKVIRQAVARSDSIRAGIRRPIGEPAKVHVAVVDRDGDIVGVFRMIDGTRFSYDVAVQKARTSAFFSDDQHAFSTRAVGFVSQGFYPPGIEHSEPGPLYQLQNFLSLPANMKGPLGNGITIFPGGVPLYKNGELVGAVGVSGDGVDQDDIIAFSGSRGYLPPSGTRSDVLSEQQRVNHLINMVREIDDNFGLLGQGDLVIERLMENGLDGVRLPYVKFPRRPEL